MLNSKRLFRIFCAFSVIAALFVNCSKPEDVPDPKLSLQTTAVLFAKEGGTYKIIFSANNSWSATTDAQWFTISPSSGTGSKYTSEITLTVEQNIGDERSATVTITSGSLPAVTVSVSQSSGASTISQFLAAPVNTTTWHMLKGEIVAIADNDYGNFYISDNTGYVYVYGLTAAKAQTNDKTFKNLNLKVGDTVTMMALRSRYSDTDEAGGTIPAYYVKSTAGAYKGTKASSTTAGWMELPKTSSTDGYDILIHYLKTPEFGGKRSYSLYWDYTNLVALWEAYPLCKNYRGAGQRSDAWSLNPLLDADKQPILSKKSYQVGNGGSYVRGHQVPSADRLNYRDNIETFFGTNIMPQDSDFNTAVWSSLEDKIRTWSNNCDTLYVVTGCDVRNSTTFVYDNVEKKVTVPVGCYKAVLRYSKTEGYIGFGAYFNNAKSSSGSFDKTKAMSIDELEAKLGIDFFVNLPGAVGNEKAAQIEAEKPATQTWWWN